jgi:protein-S-isoprenylcysteine O-methyltransferase Ste14
MSSLDSFVLIIWVIFWLYWLIAAFGSKRNTRHSWNYSARFRLIFLLSILVAVRLSGTKGTSLGHSTLAVHSASIKVVGVLLFAAGLGFAVWARVYLGKNWGMPMSEKVEPELVTSGPYKYVRHPIYTGILTATFGTALAVSLYWLLIFLGFGAYFIFSATREEKYLVSQFGKTYVSYKQKSKMLIPFVL